MRRVFVVAALCLGAAGCSSIDLPSLESLKPAPPNADLSLESEPNGALATTSAGPSCTTPCTVKVPADKDVTVTFTLDKFEPQTVNVALTEVPGDPVAGLEGPPKPGFDPNPVAVTLTALPPPKPKRRRVRKPAVQRQAPRPVATRPAPPPADEEASPFPPPPQRDASPFPAPPQ